MSIPPPPPPPPGAPPPPTFALANTEPPRLNRNEQKGRGALLSEICKGAQLKKTAAVNDRSAPVFDKPKGGSGPSPGGALMPMGGLFPGGSVPRLRHGASPEISSGIRSQAPRPPVSIGRSPDDSGGSIRSSTPETGRAHRPSLPDILKPPSSASPGMKHSTSAPPPPPPPGRRLVAAPPPSASPTFTSHSAKPYNNNKPLPTPGNRAPAAPSVRPPPSPLNTRTTSSHGQPLPPPPYRHPPSSINGPPSPINEHAPELPQRQNSLHHKAGAPRGLAPPPPPINSSPGGHRPPPPARDPPGRGPAPPPPPPIQRNGGRDAPPPPPPSRTHGINDSSQNRAKPPPPPSRTPSGPPPPPPPVRNGHRDSVSIGRSFAGAYSGLCRQVVFPLKDTL
uniref:WH2 domain-containing protein n=1 Tax=Leptobrachium leishanense TaxID=445787 RepID=A0A8C5QEU9_9ANUR